MAATPITPSYLPCWMHELTATPTVLPSDRTVYRTEVALAMVSALTAEMRLTV
jgi:hypothetical protein